MKCPYRKVTIDLKSMGLEGTEEGFADCYKEECPYYVPERQLSSDIMTTEYYIRVERE